MIGFLKAILVLFFTFQLTTAILAQEPLRSKEEQPIANKPNDLRTSQYPGKSDNSDRGGQGPRIFQKTAGRSSITEAADSFNFSKERILGMDPTIAVFVVFSLFLVLVVAIVALSQGRPHD